MQVHIYLAFFSLVPTQQLFIITSVKSKTLMFLVCASFYLIMLMLIVTFYLCVLSEVLIFWWNRCHPKVQITMSLILSSLATPQVNLTWFKPMCMLMVWVIENKDWAFGLTLLRISTLTPSFGTSAMLCKPHHFLTKRCFSLLVCNILYIRFMFATHTHTHSLLISICALCMHDIDMGICA